MLFFLHSSSFLPKVVAYRHNDLLSSKSARLEHLHQRTSRKAVLLCAASSSRRFFLRQLAVSCISVPLLIRNSAGGHASTDTTAADYDAYADSYDALDSDASPLSHLLGIEKARQELVGKSFGDVLETAIGTGANLVYYGPRVKSITGLDSSKGMLSRAGEKVRNGRLNTDATVELMQGNVENLMWARGKFDCVIDTFSLCVFDNPLKALMAMKNAVKKSPSSRVLLLEHAKSDAGVLGWYQDATASTIAKVGKGCYWNQNVSRMAEEVGLIPIKVNRLLGGTIVKGEFRVCS